MVTKADLALMPTAADLWAAKFRSRIVDRCIAGGWNLDQAWAAAEAEYNGLDEPIDITDDPEASADESMSYWDADE